MALSLCSTQAVFSVDIGVGWGWGGNQAPALGAKNKQTGK